MGAEPEAEGLAGRHAREELREALVIAAGRIVGVAAGTKIARPPALTNQADVITGLFKQVGVNRVFLGKRAPEIGPLFESMRILSRENRSPRGGAGRCCAKAVVEQHPFAGDAIKRRGLDHPIAIDRRVRPAPIVGQAEEDVWAASPTSGRWFSGGCQRGEEQYGRGEN